MTILFAPEAEADFRALVEYLQSRNPVAAAALADRIFAVIDQLASGDFEGPEQTLRTGDRLRSWPVPPVRIYYQCHDTVLWIARIYHQSRPPL